MSSNRNTETDAAAMQSLLPGLAAALPEGIIQHEPAFTEHDYILTAPLNMKAADDLILKAVLEARAAMDPEGVLYVVFGENHLASSHILLQTGLTENLATRKNAGGEPEFPLLVSLEMPYNMLSACADQLLNRAVDPARQALDPKGRTLARMIVAHKMSAMALESVCRRFEAALRHDIPLLPADAGRMESEGEQCIDNEDPVAARIALDRYGIDLDTEDIDASGDFDPAGMEIRNAVMAERAVAGAAAHGAKIVISPIGLVHLGNKNDSVLQQLLGGDDGDENEDAGLPFETSYPAELARLTGPKDRILSIFCAHAAAGYTPESITPPGGHPRVTPFILRGLAEDKFQGSKTAKEKTFIKKLAQSYGAETPPAHYRPGPPPDKKAVTRELAALFTPEP